MINGPYGHNYNRSVFLVVYLGSELERRHGDLACGPMVDKMIEVDYCGRLPASVDLHNGHRAAYRLILFCPWMGVLCDEYRGWD